MSYISSRRINFQIQQNQILENRVIKSIEDLTKIQPFMPTQGFDFKTKEIQSNISEERFIEMIQYFKEKITEGICSKLCHQEFTNMRIMLVSI